MDEVFNCNSPRIIRTFSHPLVEGRSNVRHMTSHNSHVEILGSPERRRRWTTSEKLSMVQETYEAGSTVSLVARRHGVALNQLFGWRKLAVQGASTATSADEEVVPSSQYRALEQQVRELQRLLGKKAMERSS